MKRITVALVIILSAVSLRAATPEAVFASARQALNSGDAEKAADLFEQAIKLKPTEARYHVYLASAYGTMATQSKNPLKQASLAKKTRTTLERAVQLDPNNVEARLGLVDFYSMAPGFMGGGDDKALGQANELRKRDSLAGHRAYARIHLINKKPELAHKEFEDAIREQPKSAKPRYYYALQLGLSEKNYKGAFEQLEYAARAEPGYMPTLFRLGHFAVLAQSNYPRGEEALKKYLTYTPAEDDPPHNRTWYWLGQIYEKLGRRQEAKQAFQSSLKIAPNAKEVREALKRVM